MFQKPKVLVKYRFCQARLILPACGSLCPQLPQINVLNVVANSNEGRGCEFFLRGAAETVAESRERTLELL